MRIVEVLGRALVARGVPVHRAVGLRVELPPQGLHEGRDCADGPPTVQVAHGQVHLQSSADIFIKEHDYRSFRSITNYLRPRLLMPSFSAISGDRCFYIINKWLNRI